MGVPIRRQLHSIAAFTVLEAVRVRFFWLAGGILLAALLTAEFAGALALTEAVTMKAALFGFLLRVAAVFAVCLFVAASQTREYADKGTEMLLALPLSRAVYYFGKLAGYGAVALLVAAAAGVVAAVYAPLPQAILWAAALGCEMLLMVAVTLLCLLTLTQVATAISVVAGFYLLCRAIAAMQLIGHSPLIDAAVWSNQFIAALLDTLACVLPELYRFAPSEWLVYHNADFAALWPVLGQTAVYLLLVAGASLFDLYRRNY